MDNDTKIVENVKEYGWHIINVFFLRRVTRFENSARMKVRRPHAQQQHCARADIAQSLDADSGQYRRRGGGRERLCDQHRLV
jgi:predicted chitinase